MDKEFGQGVILGGVIGFAVTLIVLSFIYDVEVSVDGKLMDSKLSLQDFLDDKNECDNQNGEFEFELYEDGSLNSQTCFIPNNNTEILVETIELGGILRIAPEGTVFETFEEQAYYQGFSKEDKINETCYEKNNRMFCEHEDGTISMSMSVSMELP